MKRLLLFLLIILRQISAFALVEKNVDLAFDLSDFSFDKNSNGETLIASRTIDFNYEDDTDLPCLPFAVINVAVPGNCEFSALDYNADSENILTGIILARNPEVLPTNISPAEKETSPAKYGEPAYPDKRVTLTGSHTVGNWSIFSFKVFPFAYDASAKVISFSKKVNLKISMEETAEIQKKSATNKSALLQRNDESLSLLKKVVVNPEDIAAPSGQQKEAPLLAAAKTVDYLIITATKLKDAFYPLREWKMTKGVRTEIITTEEISSKYSGKTMQLKIKQCLYDYYENYGLQYALLGGDDTVVPVQGCYIYDSATLNYSDMPVDLFYACFDGAFDWDENKNGVYGETIDNLNFYPHIYVTRAPVRTATHVEAFVNKVLTYEKKPALHGWNNQVLMCGTKLSSYNGDKKSDAELKGEVLYTNYFKWTGSRKRFYDTNTDFPGGASYDVNIQNIQDQITNGYSFIEMISHGDQLNWNMETGSPYSVSDASTSIGYQPSVITTIACLTNAFDDKSDPCLSESFIRNPNNGVTAYLGCSREGWYSGKLNDISLSLMYEAKFYENVFADNDFKNFGRMVANAKYELVGFVKNSKADPHRWLMYGLNPIGDAEMPIRTDTPKYFENVAVSRTQNWTKVTSGVPGCTICMMSKSDMGASFYQVYHNVQSVIFTHEDTDVSICVTKPNYVPYIKDFGTTYIQNENVNGPRTISDSLIVIGSDVTTSKAPGPVEFQKGDVIVKAKTIIIENGTTMGGNSNVTLSND